MVTIMGFYHMVSMPPAADSSPVLSMEDFFAGGAGGSPAVKAEP
jgi:hypothetical protein